MKKPALIIILPLSLLIVSGCASLGKASTYDWSHPDSDVFGGKSFLDVAETPSSSIPQNILRLGDYLRFFDYPDSRAGTRKEYRYGMISGVKRAPRPGSGINIGNTLDAPSEGAWGPTLETDTFRVIRDAGFSAVRIPVRFQTHLSSEAPLAIEPEFLKRVDWAVQSALGQGLTVILDFHHFLEDYPMEDFASEAEKAATVRRFTSIWSILALRYRDYPATLRFELLNEPRLPFSRDIWNAVAKETLSLIRATGGANATRTVVIGCATYSHVGALAYLDIPTHEEDPNVVVTFHYYEPFSFTHQGASWGAMRPLTGFWRGNAWTGTEKQKNLVRADMDIAAKWAEERKRSLILGEFGAIVQADRDSRVAYIRFVREEAEKRGIAWFSWCFDARDSFGLYDTERDAWKAELLGALIPSAPDGER